MLKAQPAPLPIIFGMRNHGARMATNIEKIRATMFSRPDPIIFRSAAYIAAGSVVGINHMLGGSWWAMLIAVLLIAGSSIIFPANRTKHYFRRRMFIAFNSVGTLSWQVRISCSACAIIGISLLDYVADFDVGRGFNLYLLCVFISSLLFGLPVSILTWLLSSLAAYYCLIGPGYGFQIDSLQDFAELIGYWYLGLVTLAIPALIRASAADAAP